jgi:hypothetical protein
MLNFQAAWVGILLGFISGAVLGLFFYQEEWMGGYFSWRRRMARLGHISFFGIAIINLAFAMSQSVFGIEIATPLPSYLFIAGAVTMPLVCFLSSYKMIFRHLFFIPVLSLLIGTVLFLTKGLFA